jgi:hypothetical protein
METKMKMKTIMIFGALVLTLSACATDPIGGLPIGAVRMTAGEIVGLTQRLADTKAFIDNGYDGGLTYQIRSNGIMQVTSRFVIGKKIAGQWRVDTMNATFCTRIETDPENCAPLYKLSDDRFYLDASGGSLKENTLIVRKGS